MSDIVSRGVRLRASRVHFSSGATIDAAISITSAEMLDGLRSHVRPTPMLFVFPNPAPLAMTMRGVKFPLDMIFLDESGDVVDVVYEAAPGRPIVASRAPARYCLELPAGWAAGMNIRIGDRAMFTPLVRSQ